MDAAMYASVKKGLYNEAGENNCFLNVVIQALWHMKSFRHRFQTSDVHEHRAGITPSACPHCALSVIFNQYKYSDSNAIPPNILRRALHTLYESESKFQLGAFDDAAEALDAVLSCIEKVSPHPARSIPRRVFGMDIMEYTQCNKCKTRSEPAVANHYIYYSYVSAVQALRHHHPRAPFEDLLRTVAHQDMRSCANEANCQEKLRVLKRLEQHPDVFSVGLVWPTADPSGDEIVAMLSTVAAHIDLSRIFSPHRTRSRHKLRGMICYYGMHYDAYFYSDTRRQWLVFDDTTVKQVGDWPAVIHRCRRGRFHPSVLFYERDPYYTPPAAAVPSPARATPPAAAAPSSSPSAASSASSSSHSAAPAPAAPAPPTPTAAEPPAPASAAGAVPLVTGYVNVPQGAGRPVAHAAPIPMFGHSYYAVPQWRQPPQ